MLDRHTLSISELAFLEGIYLSFHEHRSEQPTNFLYIFSFKEIAEATY